MPVDIATLQRPTLVGNELLAIDDGSEIPKAVSVGSLRADHRFNMTIYEEDGQYYALNGETGAIHNSGPVLHEVIQAALYANGSRTSPNRFALCGELDLAGTVVLPSWTDLYIFGKVTAAANLNSLFSNSNQVAGNTNIRVFGGTIDGAVTVFAGSLRKPLSFKKVTNLVVEGVTAINAGSHCISLESCVNPTVIKNTCRNSGDDLISCLQSTGYTIDYNDLSVTRSDSGGSGCVEAEDSSGKGSISHNHIYNAYVGIKLILDPGAVHEPVNDTTIQGNNIHDMTGDAISLVGNKVGAYSSNVAIGGNHVADILGAAYSASRARGITFTGNTAARANRGVYIGPGSQRITIVGLELTDMVERGIFVYGTSLASEDTSSRDIHLTAVHVYRNGVAVAKATAFQFSYVHNWTVSQCSAIDDRTPGNEGLQYVLRSVGCTGHMVCMMLTGLGNDFGGSNPISVGGGQVASSIIGNNGHALYDTNITIPAP